MASFNIIDIRGQWIAHQSNGFDVSFNVPQVVVGQDSNGQVRPLVNGTAKATQAGGPSGTIKEGFLSATEFHVIVNWDGGARGDYSGTLGMSTRLRGITFDIDHPQSQATWISQKLFSLIQIEG